MFDGDIYEKLFGKKNNTVKTSDNAMNYTNQAKQDLSKLYNNNYISPNGTKNRKNNGMNGTTGGMNGMTGDMNGMTGGMNSMTDHMNGMANGMNSTTGNMNGMPLKPFPDETPLAMAYIPFQQWQETYEESKAFARGTIFPCLDKPFIGKGAVNNVSK